MSRAVNDESVAAEDLEPVPPIEVHVVNIPKEQSRNPDIASFNTFQYNGDGSTPAQQILAQQDRRARCIITINGTAGDYVVLGRQGQVSNKQGGRYYVGNSFEYKAKSQVVLIPYGVTTSTNAVQVTVEEELYV